MDPRALQNNSGVMSGSTGLLDALQSIGDLSATIRGQSPARTYAPVDMGTTEQQFQMAELQRQLTPGMIHLLLELLRNREQDTMQVR